MLPQFACSLRWFACFAMILVGIVATAATGCTNAYAGDCSLNQQLNGGHCGQVQQIVAPQRIIVQQQVQPYYQQQLVQQVVVPHRQQIVVQQVRQHHNQQQIVVQQVRGHQQLRQQIVVQQQRQPRRSVQTQRIVTRNR